MKWNVVLSVKCTYRMKTIWSASLTAEHAGIALGLHPAPGHIFIHIHDGISQLALYLQQSEVVIHFLRLDHVTCLRHALLRMNNKIDELVIIQIKRISRLLIANLQGQTKPEISTWGFNSMSLFWNSTRPPESSAWSWSDLVFSRASLHNVC